MAAGAARPHSRQQSRVLARNAPLIDSDSDDDDYIPAYLVQSSESEESLIADSEEEQLNRRDRRQAQGRGSRTKLIFFPPTKVCVLLGCGCDRRYIV